MINYDGRRFHPVPADGTDDEGVGDRVALYRQNDDLIWGEFTGGRARRGSLAGTCGPDGKLDFAYCMVLDSGEVISGHCTSIPRILDDGRIQLDEVWQRYGPHESVGISRLHEIR
ncbi:hypothetical protein [Actinophytocola sp.]|jgi:hypothetical protein|uniref:hypothetical protein n=1 Tax=Actinophytocola sp. TaxID=1872138 RepID=UPI002D42F131|nr:hypothetical protein [Actinophytocola sp.]HYQ66095.1 hypothetical protein [Actinophytocola sp.]